MFNCTRTFSSTFYCKFVLPKDNLKAVSAVTVFHNSFLFLAASDSSVEPSDLQVQPVWPCHLHQCALWVLLHLVTSISGPCEYYMTLWPLSKCLVGIVWPFDLHQCALWILLDLVASINVPYEYHITLWPSSVCLVSISWPFDLHQCALWVLLDPETFINVRCEYYLTLWPASMCLVSNIYWRQKKKHDSSVHVFCFLPIRHYFSALAHQIFFLINKPWINTWYSVREKKMIDSKWFYCKFSFWHNSSWGLSRYKDTALPV